MNTFVNKVEKMYVKYLIETLWPKIGIKIIKTYTNKNDQENKGDYQIIYKCETYNIDIKAEYDMPPNFPIELLQDIRTCDLGWFYKLQECNGIYYGCFNKDWSVRYNYGINLPKLRRYDFMIGRVKWNNDPKRYGYTIFFAAPLDHLVKLNIAEKI